MFVAASLGSGVFTQERQVGMRTFLSPTVVAFASFRSSSPPPYPDAPTIAASTMNSNLSKTRFFGRRLDKMTQINADKDENR